ncbi:cyanophycin metabolism-associated DUF1854 family protein [Bordetella genomosp. 9]|uniref:DUF1854 domain-containing protein n=1 Tax=Bordetella genomosp. 9 TaxID=1416803 RepID=A0A1W6YY62_9BORD|nr:DUF1854 domain-containing protein [Bordetella genomosp. 9]ARP85931.1 hypothetical protein CAL13_06740 [Bordetella genomosp. 9]ARP89952.1 hypothetical protein CAL14_06335 [Bordetella genomosp. 9]
MGAPDFRLRRNPHGRLVYEGRDGAVVDGVVPVRAFPISAPEAGCSLVDAGGHEVAWIDRVDDLPHPMRVLVQEALAAREFMPRIQRIASVSGYATPCTWSVQTDRGPTAFVLRGEEDIRRLGGQALLIADSHGIHYLIGDMRALDKQSRKLLDRFL